MEYEEDVLHTLRLQVEQRPFASLIMAIAVGVLVGCLIGKRSSDDDTHRHRDAA